MISNRVTAVSGCPCGELPPYAPPTDVATANPTQNYGPWAVIGGAVIGIAATAWAMDEKVTAKGKQGLKVGLGGLAGATLGYLIARSWGYA